MQRAARLHQQQGIAIGPILFVVAILAVLATAIAAGSSSFSSSTDSERARTLASALIDEAFHVRQAVMRVMALGCIETQLNFYVANHSSYMAANAQAPTDRHCNIFSPEGGGLIFTPLLAQVCDPSVTLPACARVANGEHIVPQIGSSDSELLYLQWYLRDDVCHEINRQLGRATDATVTGVARNAFQGSYTNSRTFHSNFSGVMAACINNSGGNVFYSVLLPR